MNPYDEYKVMIGSLSPAVYARIMNKPTTLNKTLKALNNQFNCKAKILDIS